MINLPCEKEGTIITFSYQYPKSPSPETSPHEIKKEEKSVNVDGTGIIFTYQQPIEPTSQQSSVTITREDELICLGDDGCRGYCMVQFYEGEDGRLKIPMEQIPWSKFRGQRARMSLVTALRRVHFVLSLISRIRQ